MQKQNTEPINPSWQQLEVPTSPNSFTTIYKLSLHCIECEVRPNDPIMGNSSIEEEGNKRNDNTDFESHSPLSREIIPLVTGTTFSARITFGEGKVMHFPCFQTLAGAQRMCQIYARQLLVAGAYKLEGINPLLHPNPQTSGQQDSTVDESEVGNKPNEKRD